MRYRIIIFERLPANAMALYPFIIFKDRKYTGNARLIRHECIHFRQQIELLIFPFYLLYALNYLWNLLIYKNHDHAYLNICFEREAYANDADVHYLTKRKMFAWMGFKPAKK